jgi:5'-3' exonuclease
MAESANTLYDVSFKKNITPEEQLPLLLDIAHESLSYYIIYHTLKNMINLQKVDNVINDIHDLVTEIHS